MIDGNGNKWIKATKLAELLAKLPPESRVMSNKVGNLLVIYERGDRAIAFIDFIGEGEAEDME